MTARSITRDEAERLVSSTFVKSLHYYSCITSTNDAALTTPVAATELPALFLAEEQTSGRGRGTNRWVSSEGALTFSLVVAPAMLRTEVACWPQLSLWTALGIRDSIASFTTTSDVRVKWPNDVFLQNRKVCGILIETTSSPESASSSESAPRLVVGVGINVNNDLARTSPNETANATSIRDARSEWTSLEEVAQSVLTHIDEAWSLFAAHHSLLDHWPNHCLLTGKQVRWQRSTKSVYGICQGISDDGALLLKTKASALPMKCLGGTITFEG